MTVQITSKKISSDLLFRVLFHVIFWFFWLVLPILNSIMDDDKSRYEWLILTLPLGFFTMPFFYFNSEFLIRKFLHKGQLTSYIMSLLVMFSVFLFAFYSQPRELAFRTYEFVCQGYLKGRFSQTITISKQSFMHTLSYPPFYRNTTRRQFPQPPQFLQNSLSRFIFYYFFKGWNGS